MLAPLAFLIAGFFFHAFPYGPLTAFLLQGWGMWSTRHFYRMWWQRSPRRAVQLVATQLTLAVVMHTILMLPGNYLRGLL